MGGKLVKRIILLVFILLIIFPLALARPLLPNEFYGSAQSFNNPASPGTTIKVYDNDLNLCGSFIVQKTGYYGVMSCAGKNTDGSGSGPGIGDSLRFKVGSDFASAIKGSNIQNLTTIKYEEGEFTQLTLVAPPLVCGDAFCDHYESCATCELDCGACPIRDGSGNGTGSGAGAGGDETTGGATGDEGATGGATSGNAGSGGAGGAATGGLSGIPGIRESVDIACEEIWVCTDWGPCMPEGKKYRECEDIESCGTNENMPETSEDCLYIRNQTDKQEEQNITLPNFTSRPPRKEAPQVIEDCSELLPILSIPSVLFIALFLVLISAAFGRLKSKIKHTKKNKELKVIEKLQLIFKTKKETYIFSIIVTVLSIIVYLYHFFFFVCKDAYIKNLWLLALLIVITPIIINILIEIMKYRESVKLAREKMLRDTHYKHLQDLLEITNRHLIELEEKIEDKINGFENNDDFHVMLTNVPELSQIYKDINKLFYLYKEHKDAIDVERDLLRNISKLDEDKSFSNILTNHPEFKELRDDLKELFDKYKDKQNLYDDLSKIEDEYFSEDESSN